MLSINIIIIDLFLDHKSCARLQYLQLFLWDDLELVDTSEVVASVKGELDLSEPCQKWVILLVPWLSTIDHDGSEVDEQV